MVQHGYAFWPRLSRFGYAWNSIWVLMWMLITMCECQIVGFGKRIQKKRNTGSCVTSKAMTNNPGSPFWVIHPWGFYCSGKSSGHLAGWQCIALQRSVVTRQRCMGCCLYNSQDISSPVACVVAVVIWCWSYVITYILLSVVILKLTKSVIKMFVLHVFLFCLI